MLSNELAKESDLFIFSDGGRDKASWDKVRKMRNYLHTISGFRSVTIVERECNYYVERNIIEGINELLQHHDRIIVIEDDVCIGPNCLKYFADALDFYEQDKRVIKAGNKLLPAFLNSK